MKIAVYHNLPSGGGKRALYEMVRRLVAYHSIDIFTLSTAEQEFCDVRPFAGKCKVFPFKPLPLATRPFGRVNQGIRSVDLFRLQSLQKEIAVEIDNADYDFVFVHNCQFGQSPSLMQFLNTPSVYYCQEPPRLLYEPVIERPYNTLSRAQRLGNRLDPLPGIYRSSLLRIDRRNVRSASMVLVNSHYSRETLYRTYGIFARVSRLGVDFEKFRPLNIGKKDQIVTVGAITPLKGFDFLISSIALIDPGIRPSLIVVSNFVESREQSYLLQLSYELGVKFEIRACISDQELVRLYNQSLMTIYAPLMEPFGFMPLESMSCGTPVIAVREAGVRETILHGVTGLLVERDPEKFATALQQLLDNDDLREELAKGCRDYVQREWSWDRAVQALEERFHDVAHRCPDNVHMSHWER